jgi:hypothetical protein
MLEAIMRESAFKIKRRKGARRAVRLQGVLDEGGSRVRAKE